MQRLPSQRISSAPQNTRDLSECFWGKCLFAKEPITERPSTDFPPWAQPPDGMRNILSSPFFVQHAYPINAWGNPGVWSLPSSAILSDPVLSLTWALVFFWGGENLLWKNQRAADRTPSHTIFVVSCCPVTGFDLPLVIYDVPSSLDVGCVFAHVDVSWDGQAVKFNSLCPWDHHKGLHSAAFAPF